MIPESVYRVMMRLRRGMNSTARDLPCVGGGRAVDCGIRRLVVVKSTVFSTGMSAGGRKVLLRSTALFRRVLIRLFSIGVC